MRTAGLDQLRADARIVRNDPTKRAWATSGVIFFLPADPLASGQSRASAWAMLAGEVPLAWIGIPRHCPVNIPCIIDSPSTRERQAAPPYARVAPSTCRDAVAAHPDPANARR